MSGKDYELIAGVIRRAMAAVDGTTDRARAQRAGIRFVANNLADELRRENPRFDKDRFLVAAGTVLARATGS